jgi:tRNA pseudouridine32 synthase/23S rRNA pseudouridine746 synthase
VVPVLHEDEALLAVDKPPGRIVIPGRGAPETTLREELEATHGKLWVVHRLDRGTSGVLLFARTAAAHRALSLAFEGRDVAKTYLALVRGHPPAELVIDAPIAAGRKGKMRVATGEFASRGKASRTRVRLLEQAGELARVECLPDTGRTHQIRVHLAHAGFPLAFDPDYGSEVPLANGAGTVVLARTPLHAAALEIPHPTTGERLVLRAPMPADMAAAMEAARR